MNTRELTVVVRELARRAGLGEEACGGVLGEIVDKLDLDASRLEERGIDADKEKICRTKRRNNIDTLIYEAIEGKLHPFLEADMIYSDQLCLVLGIVYSDHAYFQYNGYDKADIQKRKHRSMGMHMRKLDYVNRRTRAYTSRYDQDEVKHRTTNRTIWILRNAELYQDLSEVELYQEADRQWRLAAKQLNHRWPGEIPSFI